MTHPQPAEVAMADDCAAGNSGTNNCGWCRTIGSSIRNGWFIVHVKELLKLSLPISLTAFFQLSLLWISLLFLGHLPDLQDQGSYLYSAAGLATAFINVTGRAIGIGLATASDTLSSQAFGYKNYKRVGIILQRGILILGLVMFPIWALWLNSESLLLLVQQPPCVARFSGFLVNLFTLALPFSLLYILLQRYLQSQSVVWLFVLTGLAANVINVILHATTIYGMKIGFTGAAVSLMISNMLPPLIVIVYVWCRKLHKETWGGWSFESLEEWGLFMKLAIPGTLMVALEWWSFEITNFLAGALGEVELSANIVWFQLLSIFYMPCVGLFVATSIRVGNELGAGNPKEAKRATYTAIASVFIFAIATSIFLLSTKDVISQLFIPGDEEVAHEVSRLVYIGVVFVISDQFQSVMGGALRGCGRQYVGAVVSFIAYYIIALPLGAAIGFKTELGLFGIWIGMLVGNVAQSVAYVITLVLTDWKKQSEKAIKRSQQSSSNLPSKLQSEDVEMDNCGEGAPDTSSLSSKDSDEDEDTEALLSEVEMEEVEKDDRTVRVAVDKREKRSITYKLRKLLVHGSFFVLGASILIAGGVSSRYHPYVDPEEYYNCTNLVNSTTSAA